MDKIRSATLNVRGIIDPLKRDMVFQEIIQKNLDIALLMETHTPEGQSQKYIDEWFAASNNKAIFPERADDETFSGVAILFGKNFPEPQIQNQKISVPGRSLSIETNIEGKLHKIMVTYAPTNYKLRTPFFTQIRQLEQSNIPVIWGGDFNHVEDPTIDREATTPNRLEHTAGATAVALYKNAHNLVDPFRVENPTKKIFTHEQTTRSGNISRSRIDRILIPKNYRHHKTTAVTSIVNKPAQLDHRMVICEFTPSHTKNSKKGKGVFLFNTQLLKDPDFDLSCRVAIDEISGNDYPGISGPLDHYEAVKAAIKIHAMTETLQKHMREKAEIDAALTALQTEENKENPSQNTISAIKQQIANIERLKIEALLLHNKMDAIEHDEKPSSYFYERLKSRARKTHINKLNIVENDTQTTTEEQNKILKAIHKFYTDLYNEYPNEICEEAQDILINKLDKTLPEETTELLEADLTLDELKKALKGMKNNKTPGIDGLPSELYKHFSDILLPLLLNAAHCIKAIGKMSNTQRSAIVALLHKKGERADLKNWRPISLLCTDYKILTKALANRMIPTLEKIIHPNQTCGIPNRTIHNNTWLLRDLIDYATEIQDLTIIFSLDQEKLSTESTTNTYSKSSEKWALDQTSADGLKSSIQTPNPTYKIMAT